MPEDEAQAVDDGGGGGLMNGSRGWIIVISIVVLEAVFFIVLMKYRASNEPADTSAGPGVKAPTSEEYMKVIIPMKGLTYSIPMASGQPMTLAMDIDIVLSKSQQEIQNNLDITQQDWDKFKKTVDKMVPVIKDWLYQTINKMSSSELQTERGMQDIRSMVMEKVNQELDKLNLGLSSDKISKKRVQQVLITNYYFN